MAGRRRSPSPYRSKSSALMWFALCMMILTVLGAIFYQFVIKYDFEGFSSGEEPLRDFVPEDGYQRVSYPPSLLEPGTTPTSPPVPTPRPTPIPLDKYAMRNTSIMMPKTDHAVLCDLTECRASEPDDNRALVVRGWGYLENLDASGSQVYLAVSTKFGDNHRMYLTQRESGSSGIIHSASTGVNLDQADFSAIIRIENTFADGDYRLGVVVQNRNGKKQTLGYARLDSIYNFTIQGGKIVSTNW